MARQHGSVAEIFGHQRQSPLDDIAFDLLRPCPIEVGDGLESLGAAHLQPAFQAAPRAVAGLLPHQEFEEQLTWRQRDFAARAKKSSSPTGMARSPS